mmetsp:Transcript_33105/g.68940  ORF Transcript_33105/g.68940 Transcript_33105/m.68940 type:complete len:209 (+) Transcript_33105:520-1146(+)
MRTCWSDTKPNYPMMPRHNCIRAKRHWERMACPRFRPCRPPHCRRAKFPLARAMCPCQPPPHPWPHPHRHPSRNEPFVEGHHDCGVKRQLKEEVPLVAIAVTMVTGPFRVAASCLLEANLLWKIYNNNNNTFVKNEDQPYRDRFMSNHWKLLRSLMQRKKQEEQYLRRNNKIHPVIPQKPSKCRCLLPTPHLYLINSTILLLAKMKAE